MGTFKRGFLGGLGDKISEAVDRALGGVEDLFSGTSSHGGTINIITTKSTFFTGGVLTGGGPCVKGDGPVVFQERELGPFKGVSSSVMADVEVTVASERRVVVHAQANLIDFIETTVEGGLLCISMKNGSYQSTEPMHVEVFTPNLEEIRHTGHGSFDAVGVKEHTFTLNASGMGDISVQGTAQTVCLTLRGLGDVQLRDLTVIGDVQLKHSGMGDLDLHTNGIVTGIASGHGNITVWGSAMKWRVDHTGIGDVRFR